MTPPNIVTDAYGFQPLKPGPGRPRGEVTADQRARVEQAMVRLVGAEGYEAITVRKLAAMAHVSTGTFYSLFSGTDQCFLEVHKALVGQVRLRTARTRSLSLNREEQATLSLRTLAHALTDDPGSTRIIATEVFAGGPAALGPAREGEALVAAALKESVDRRGEHVPIPVATWITAGTFHWARSFVTAESRPIDRRTIREMVEWGMRVIRGEQLAGAETAPGNRVGGLCAATNDKEHDSQIKGDDAELLLAAAKRLTLAEGYRRLTVARISRGAGLTTSAFKRHFGSVEAVYLEVVGGLAARLFGVAPIGRSRQGSHRGPDAVEVCRRIAADPATARLALLGIAEPGREGLSCTARLITRVAAACGTGRREGREHSDPTAEAAVAGLWVVLADGLAGGEPQSLLGTARTLDRLFAAATSRSILGRQAS